MVKSSSQTQPSYTVAASLTEFELKKILMDKIEANKYIERSDTQKQLYQDLVDAYEDDKELFESYGGVIPLKRGRDDKDEDNEPPIGSGPEPKRRRTCKEPKRSTESKKSKSTSSSKDTSRSKHKSSGKSAQEEESSHPHDQEYVTGQDDEQLTEEEVTKEAWFKKPDRPPTPDHDWAKRMTIDFRPPQKWISEVAHAEDPHTSFDELTDTPFDFLAFIMNRLNVTELTQELLAGLTFELLKGTCKSLPELEYHFQECSKATRERLEWHNPEDKPYPFDLRKPLQLVQNDQGRQVIPKDYFINNNLEYLKGGSLSRQYTTSVTKTKAAMYDLKWIEDMVPELWTPQKVDYDRHAYWGTYHWGLKRQKFYGFASNRISKRDVYSKRRIIVVTRVKIIKWFDYGHLDMIEVRRDDQQLYKFKEGDFPRLRLEDIKDMLLLLTQ
ncbi:hypothetical protein Tco_0065062 [Tanacetum coccineum]